ncbi:MAG TPA: hypothetical protein VJ874_05175 [Candidatus Thermoplasmatota archaeon]|nr:hypothetical protein [Candidatus Thermoplasmatota archaeon]
METQAATSIDARDRPAWPPRLGRMYAFTLLMFLSLGAPSLIQLVIGGRPEVATQWAVTAAGFALLALFAVLAHRDYKVARAALDSDPTLRGRWLTENAWWVGYVALVLPWVLWGAFTAAGVFARF